MVASLCFLDWLQVREDVIICRNSQPSRGPSVMVQCLDADEGVPLEMLHYKGGFARIYKHVVPKVISLAHFLVRTACISCTHQMREIRQEHAFDPVRFE